MNGLTPEQRVRLELARNITLDGSESLGPGLAADMVEIVDSVEKKLAAVTTERDALLEFVTRIANREMERSEQIYEFVVRRARELARLKNEKGGG